MEKANKRKFIVSEFFEKWNTVIVFVVIVVAASLLTSNFLQTQNLTNLLKQNAGIGIIAMGMLLVILTGGIDLSVGSIVGVGNVIFAYMMQTHSVGYSIGVTLLVGAACGAISGYFISYRNLQPFVVTLSIMTVARGYAYIICKGASISIKNPGFLGFGYGTFLGIPRQTYLMILIFLLILFVLKFTTYGRIVTAIGSNEEAVRLSGIRNKIYKFSVYVVSGFFAATAAILNSARTGVGSPLTGDGFELDAIAITVIGGVSLNGGKGTAGRVLVGVFVIGMIGNIMNLTKVSAYTQQVVKGLIILCAVFMQTLQKRSRA